MTRIAPTLRRVLEPAVPDRPLSGGVPSAVMVPLLDLAEPSLLFTVRTQTVRDHKGEISFPGGVRHEEDPDLLTTALRETEEELGIGRTAFEVVGRLEATHTIVSGYVIRPFVGLLAERPTLRPNPVEIAEVLELEVARLASAEREDPRGDRPGSLPTMFSYTVDGHTVWGATGRILHVFLATLREAGLLGEEG